jgi:hypothetical protein
MTKPIEYIEGPKALENFKRGMIALFKVPKAKLEARKKQQQRKAATVRKTKQPDSGKA